MTKIPFKQLQVWIEAMDIAKDIYALTKTFPKDELFALVSQMRRSAVSVPSNIAEGSQRTTDRDFANFVAIAKGSLAELETQAVLANGLGYVEDGAFSILSVKIDRLSRKLYTFGSKLRC